MNNPILSREEIEGGRPPAPQSPALPRTFFEPSPGRAEVRETFTGPGPRISVDYTSPGVNPVVRGWAELSSDTPEELQLWAQRTYGPEAIILPGSSLGFQPGTPEFNTKFLSRDPSSSFEVFDPSQELAAIRSRGTRTGGAAATSGLMGRAGEVGAEAIETAISLAPEIAIEAGILGLSRGGAAGGTLGRISNIGGWRLRGLSRAAYLGSTSGVATAGSSALQQIIQEYQGTQAQTQGEQASQLGTEAAMATAFSLGGSALKTAAYLGLDAVIGKTSPEGERLLRAAAEINRRAEAGENVAPLRDPLIAYTSDNPVARQTFSFLSRMSSEISKYQRDFRQELLSTARGRTEYQQGQFFLPPEEEIRAALQDQYDDLATKITRASAASDSAEAGLAAASYLSAFSDESYQIASDAYQKTFTRMAEETGNNFDIRYDFSALRSAINDSRNRRINPSEVRQEDTGQPGLEVGWDRDPIVLEPGEASSWRVVNDITNRLEGLTRGTRRVPPITIVRQIQDINDQLNALGPDATDAGTSSLRAIKRGLQSALDSIPALNEGRFSQETIDSLRAANTLYRTRAEVLDSAGIVAVMRHGEQKNYSAAAAALYEGGVSVIRNVRNAVNQIEGGEAKWNTLRNNWLAYALNTAGDTGPYARWQSLPSEVKRELFSEAERVDIAQNLRALDSLVNETGFREVIDAADETGTFLDNVIRATASGGGRPRALMQVEQAIRRAEVNGNTAPRRAYTAGLWDHILRQSGVIATRQGETSINSRTFGTVVQRLENTGALDIMLPEDRQFLDDFVALVGSSDTELGSSASSIAVASIISEVAGGQNLGANLSRLLSAKLASNALILGNRTLTGLESSIRGTGPVNLPTTMARVAYHYAADENDISSREWEEYTRLINAPLPPSAMPPSFSLMPQ